MPALSPGDSRPVPLTSRMTLRPAGRWQGDAHVAPPTAGVLGADEEAPVTTTRFDMFTPAEPEIRLAAQPAPAIPGVLGGEEEQQAGIEYQPAEDAVYVMLQQIETPDGIIYDWTLPQPAAAAPISGVLGDEAPASGALWFPINPVVAGGAENGRPPAAAPGVLGVEDLIGGAIGGIILKRVVQMFKSPIEHALLEGVKHAETGPRMLKLGDSTKPEELFQPLEGFEAWRALLPPGAEHRVLLFVHGFASSAAGSQVGAILPEFAPRYDAILCYDHPTLSVDPLENARELLKLVPDDLRLSADLVTHSRGGLVARSLVELIDPAQQLTPRRIITHGTPHNGTRLADKERWDRLISLGMTAAQWLATASGVAIWIPKLLEYVLKAAAQGIFALPGVAAMTPGGEFITKLNAASDPAQGARAPYAAVTSSFSIFSVKQPSFQQAFRALTTQAFLDAPNDLVVPTESMSAIDMPSGALPAERQLKVGVDHFSYFKDPSVAEFLRKQLSDG
jgi:hypothetical protein